MTIDIAPDCAGLGLLADFSATPNPVELEQAGLVSFTNLSANASTYFWDFGDNTTSDAFEPVHAYGNTGAFTVTLTASAFGCTDTATLDITVLTSTDTSGLVGRADEQALTAVVYPNPTSGKLTVDVQHASGAALMLTLYDLTGREVLHQQYDSANRHTEQLDLKALPSGVYQLQLKTEHGSLIQRIVKQ